MQARFWGLPVYFYRFLFSRAFLCPFFTLFASQTFFCPLSPLSVIADFPLSISHSFFICGLSPAHFPAPSVFAGFLWLISPYAPYFRAFSGSIPRTLRICGLSPAHFPARSVFAGFPLPSSRAFHFAAFPTLTVCSASGVFGFHARASQTNNVSEGTMQRPWLFEECMCICWNIPYSTACSLLDVTQ